MLRQILSDFKKLGAFISAVLIIKFWYISVPLLLFGMLLYRRLKHE